MAVYKSLSQFYRRVEKDIEKTKKAAMKRALTATRAEFVKLVGRETGLKADELRKRVRYESRIADGLTRGTMSIGIRRKFEAHKFKYKISKIIDKRGRKSKAVSYKTRSQPYTVLAKSFTMYSKNNKELIMERKGNDKFPIATTKVDVFAISVKNNYEAIKRKMQETFDKNYKSLLKYYLKK